MWSQLFLSCLDHITASIVNLTLHVLFAGTSVVTVTATDADDQTYGNSAKLVYSILQGQPYFSVDSENGKPDPAGFQQVSADLFTQINVLVFQNETSRLMLKSC